MNREEILSHVDHTLLKPEATWPQIQQLCTEYHRLAQQAADLRGMDAGLVKVASFSSVSAQWLPMILKAFSKQYPAIEFEIQTCDFYDQIEELIITGQADCGFLRMPSLKGLQVYPLHLDQLKVIVPCGHPLSHCDPFPVEALATEPVIQLEEGDDYEIRAAFDEMGVKPIEAVGKEFDPNLHNAVMHVEDESVGENIVVEEFQKGYTYKDFVVRHSMVKVAN